MYKPILVMIQVPTHKKESATSPNVQYKGEACYFSVCTYTCESRHTLNITVYFKYFVESVALHHIVPANGTLANTY
jgi:hypothetical protein